MKHGSTFWKILWIAPNANIEKCPAVKMGNSLWIRTSSVHRRECFHTRKMIGSIANAQIFGSQYAMLSWWQATAVILGRVNSNQPTKHVFTRNYVDHLFTSFHTWNPWILRICFHLGHPTGSAWGGAGRNSRSNTFAIHAAKAFASQPREES